MPRASFEIGPLHLSSASPGDRCRRPHAYSQHQTRIWKSRTAHAYSCLRVLQKMHLQTKSRCHLGGVNFEIYNIPPPHSICFLQHSIHTFTLTQCIHSPFIPFHLTIFCYRAGTCFFNISLIEVFSLYTTLIIIDQIHHYGILSLHSLLIAEGRKTFSRF